jgi:hypothetical protein
MFINFLKKSCFVYEIMWNNIVEPDRLQMTIWYMCIACWVFMATNTLLGYVILIVLTATVAAQMCHSVVLYVHFVSYYL